MKIIVVTYRDELPTYTVQPGYSYETDHVQILIRLFHAMSCFYTRSIILHKLCCIVLQYKTEKMTAKCAITLTIDKIVKR